MLKKKHGGTRVNDMASVSAGASEQLIGSYHTGELGRIGRGLLRQLIQKKKDGRGVHASALNGGEYPQPIHQELRFPRSKEGLLQIIDKQDINNTPRGTILERDDALRGPLSLCGTS